MAAVPAVTPRQARRALGIIRVSWERDGTTSPEIQRHAIEQHAARTNTPVVDWIVAADDRRYSASRNDSKWWAKLDSAIARLEAGEVEALFVWQLSRSARHRLRWAVAIDRIESAGGVLESATELLDTTTSAGRFSRDVIVAHNVMQAELIGETWRETHQRRVRKGLPPTGGHRFGYVQPVHSDNCPKSCERTRPHGIHEPDPVTGQVLRELYRMYIAGAGYAKITRHLNESGHTDGRERWTYAGVIRMLDSGFGAGLLGHTEVVNKKRVIPPPWKRRYSQGVHDAVIDTATWDAYVARRASGSGRSARARTPYLLAGIVRCGDCGRSMHGKRTDGQYTYVCSRAATTTGVRKVSVVAWRVEKFVEEWLFGFAEDADARVAAQAARVGKRRDSEFTLRRARARIEKADERLAALTIKLADGTVSDAAYRAAAESIQADRDAAEEAVRAATSNPVIERAPAEVPRNLRDLWATLNTEQKNLLLRPLLDRVVVAPAAHRGFRGDRFTIVPRWEA
ncbi:recombinase family protein [Microbacterium resistens]|uniref:Recombinase family protein n=1 Tax=Microbacterium resistens TaxID=156977 RepID=A0ABY3RTX3_9MICO|nr:recombinase family protein [Microbacterium resistens]UGS26371.1 recombinase family protein [Microbacterium resistens]